MMFKKFISVVFMLFAFSFPTFANRYVKIVFLGNKGSGKSELLSAYFGEQRVPNPQRSQDLALRTINLPHGSENFILKVWDTIGEESAHTPLRIFFQGANICFLVVDMKKLVDGNFTPELMHSHIERWANELQELAPDCRIILVGTKKTNSAILRLAVPKTCSIKLFRL
jgi:GTPase SAR1 family protein